MPLPPALGLLTLGLGVILSLRNDLDSWDLYFVPEHTLS